MNLQRATMKSESDISKDDQKFGCAYKLKQTMHLDSISCCGKGDRRKLCEDSFNKSSLHGDVEATRSVTFSTEERDRAGMCGPVPWSLLPILLSITSSVGFVSTYFFAKSNCHTERWIFPYLSYTGTEHPESMVFGLILNTEGFFGMTIVFLAWRYYRHMGQRGTLNQVAVVFGLLSCFGVILVGNFQVSKAKVPHYSGAGLAFIVGTMYGVATSVLSRRAFRTAEPPMRYATCVMVARFTAAAAMVLALVCLSCIGIYKKGTHGLGTSEYIRNISLTTANGSCQELLSLIPAYVKVVDLMGSLTEWLLTFCLLVCLSLFAYEFKAFKTVKVSLLTSNGPMCSNNNCCQKKVSSLRSALPLVTTDDATHILLPTSGGAAELNNSRENKIICESTTSASSSIELINLSRLNNNKSAGLTRSLPNLLNTDTS
uniref:CWH43-like N-terminal domain-containing protein n=1 Tax=Ciona savignyi TaxID=51511 RepID=H2ZM75_CIOSA